MYLIHFQNIHTFTYQKILLHTLLLLVFKIVQSLKCALKAILKKPFVFEEENNCEEEINLTPQDRIDNVDWCRCGCECKLLATFAESLLIASAKILECEGSISPFNFYGQLPDY